MKTNDNCGELLCSCHQELGHGVLAIPLRRYWCFGKHWGYVDPINWKLAEISTILSRLGVGYPVATTQDNNKLSTQKSLFHLFIIIIWL